MLMSGTSDFQLLIADDDPNFRITVVEILQPHFKTIAVESGEQALDIVHNESVDLVLLDMHMHLLTGLDTIRKLRDLELDLPCILMSSQVTSEMEQEASSLDTFSVLRKPPRKRELIDTIQCALKV